MLVIAAEGLLDVEQEDKQLGLLQMVSKPAHWSSRERATTAIGCDVNKPVRSSLLFEKVKI